MSVELLVSLLVRGAIVLALAWLAVRCLPRATASLRHAVLACALAAVVALPVLAAVVPTWHAGALAAAEPAVAARAPVAEPAVDAPAGPASVVAAPAPSRGVPWSTIAVAVWLAGAALLALRLAIGAARARRIAARGEPVVVDRAESIWRALGGRGAAPTIVSCGDVDAPIVVGALAPVVVVPRAARGWTAERWRVVLLHELAHIRRRDGLANAVAQLACALHWVDPLVWLAARSLRADRELAADDAVVRDGARASSYAEHLLALARPTTAAAASPAAAAAIAMADGRLEARIAALLDGDRARDVLRPRHVAAVAGAVTVLATVVACASPEAAPAGPTAARAATASDPALQQAAERELDRAIAAHHAAGAVAIVLDAGTGAPLAIAARGDGDPRAARVPGSTMKPFTIAAALEAGVIDAATEVDCGGGVRRYGNEQVTDASPHGALDLGGVVAVSSNACTAKLAEPLGDRLADALRRYHFAAPAHIDTRSFAGAAIADGEGLHVSALDVAAGYTAFANAGAYHAPDGSSGDAGERVMSADTAHAVMTMLARVVDDADGTGHAARIDGVRVAGKTGTAETGVSGQHYASFVGIVPADAPRYVVLVGVDGVAGAGGEVAAPVFARLAARALASR